MAEQTTPARVRVTAAAAETFRHASADENPLHTDPGYARRTAFGEPVAHGVLGALLALAGLAPRPGSGPARIGVRFQDPVLIGREYTREVVEDTASRAVVRLLDGPRMLLEVTAAFRPLPGTAAGADGPPGAGEAVPRRVPRDAGLSEFAPGETVGGPYQPRWEALGRLLDELGLRERGIGPVPAGVLAWISYLAGMEAPGRAALLSEFEVSFDDAPADGGGENGGDEAVPFAVHAEVAEVQERFRMLRLRGTVTSPGLRARVRVRAFHRAEPPVSDPETLAALLPAGEPLAGRTAVVVGASRGLGAAIAQALALQGAEVYAGFHRSAQDAAAMAGRLGAAGERIRPVPGDAADPAWGGEVLARLRSAGRSPDLLLLNASPPPAGLPLAPGTAQRAAEYLSRAVELAREPLAALAGAVAGAGGRVLAVSSLWAAEPQPGWSAYVSAKSAVEGLIRAGAAEYPAASWLIARPPRLRTAMTATPLGGDRGAPVEPVAAALAHAAAAPAAPGLVKVLSFGEDGTALRPDPSAPADGRAPSPGGENTAASPRFPAPLPHGHAPEGETEAGSVPGTLALVGTFTLDPVLPPLQHWCDRLGLELRAEAAGYGQVFQELLSPGSLFARTGTGVKTVLLRTEDWPAGEECLRTAREFAEAVRTHSRRSRVPVLVMLCPPSPAHGDGRGRDEELRAAEELVARELAGVSGVHVLGRDRWAGGTVPAAERYHDAAREEAAHIPFTREGCAALAGGVARAAHTLLTPRAKVLVLDCDNTLWGGVVGEEGPGGIRLDAAHRAVQEWALARRQEGVLLCLSSKNEDADVLDALAAREDMPLRPEHLTARRVNWEPKPAGLAGLAAELDLGLDSFVFLDDNPVEVAAVRAAHPGVLALQLPGDPRAVPGFLDRIWSLDRLDVTEEDRRRGDFYRARGDRDALRRGSASFADFIRGLELEIDVAPAAPEQYPRLSQLTYRTNQFNLSAVRRSETELRELLEDPAVRARAVRVRDRFGDYGLVGLAISRTESVEGREDSPGRAVLDTFLMSCRVLGRGVEHALLSAVAGELREAGVGEFVAPFVPSERNTPVRRFFDAVLGSFAEPAEDGRVVYRAPAAAAAETAFTPEEPEEPGGAGKPERVPGREGASRAAGSSGEKETHAAERHRALTDLAEDEDPLASVLQATRPGAGPAAPARSPAAGGPAGGLAGAREAVCAVVAEVLGVPPAHLTPDTPLETLRLSSLAVVDATVRLEERYGRQPRTLFFEHTTLGSIAAALAPEGEHPGGGAPSAAPPRTGPPRPARPQDTRSQNARPRPVPEEEGDDPVAVIGLSGHYPGAEGLDGPGGLWELVLHGRSAVGPVPAGRWDHGAVHAPRGGAGRTYSGVGAFLEGVADFDAGYFGITPRDAEQMDPQQRLFLRTAVEAVQDAGHSRETLERNTGVYVGAMADDYRTFSANGAAAGRSPYPYADTYGIANRVSYFLDLTGPSLVIDTACSSSGVVLHLACEAIRRGEVAAAIAGGVNLVLHPQRHIQYAQMGMLSRGDACRPFAEGADGFVMGEGVGAVLLKPLSKALEDGDHVHGLIRGTAVNSGGRTSGFTVPSPEAQAALVAAALRSSGVPAATVGYVEAHGSGTSLGDPIEVQALTRAFGARELPESCALGSVKANIGHLEPAAGIAGLTKVLLQLRHRTLPPTPHAARPNPLLELEGGPFRLPGRAAAWEPVGREADGSTPPLRAGVSSFGAGGVNAHVVLEEFRPPDREEVPAPADGGTGGELFVLSACTAERLGESARRLAAHLRGPGRQVPLPDVAHTLRVGRDALPVRAAFPAGSREEVLDALDRIAAGTQDRSGDPVIHTGTLVRGGPLAGLFDGIPAGTAFLSGLVAHGELRALARLWVQGAGLDWQTLMPSAHARRTPLPAYPFESVPYWLPAALPPAAADPGQDGDGTGGHAGNGAGGTDDAGGRADAEEPAVVWTPRWVPAAERAVTGGPPPAAVVVLESGNGPPPGRAEAEGAEEGTEAGTAGRTGAPGRPLRVHTAADGGPDGGAAALRAVLEEAGSGGTGRPVVLIDRRIPAHDDADAAALARRLPLELGRAAAAGTLPPLVHVQVTSAGRSGPADAATAAFGRALSRETGRYRHVRVELADGVSPPLSALAAEADSADTEIRLGKDGRCVLRFQPREQAPAAEGAPGGGAGFRRGGHYLVTGGAGGIGRQIAAHLAERHGARVSLVGRSAPGAGHEQFCAGLRALGGDGCYLRADVTDRAALEEALRAARSRFGTLDGVLHAAGLVEDAPAREKTGASLVRVLAPKTTGTVLLDELTAEDRPGLFVLFSSVVGTLGNAGQCDYAAANAFLDAFAARRERAAADGSRSGHTVSVAWPLWRKGGMELDAEAAEMAVTALGLVPIGTPEALRVLEEAVRGREHRLYVSCAGADRTHAALARAGLGPLLAAPPSAPVPEPEPASPGPEAAAFGEDPAAVRELVLRHVAEVAGMRPEQVDTGTELGGLGFNSVLLTTLANRLNETFGLALTPVVFYEYPTADALAEMLSARLRAVPRTSVPAHRPARGAGTGGTPAPVSVSAPDPGSGEGAGSGDIALVGLAGRFPGAGDAGEFWQNLLDGRDLVTDVPPERWDWRAFSGDPRRERGTTDCRAGGFLDSVTAFDAAHFSLSPREASLMDPQQRLFLETCWHALEDAGYDPASFAGSRTGVFAGATLHDYLEVLRAHATDVGGHTVTGNVHAVVANRVSYTLDLRGPSETVDTACSSSLVALHRALASLRAGECEAALVGGVNVVMTPTWYVSLSRAGMLSASGRCHTFDARADGYVRAEGVGAVLLKPLAQALEDGDTVRAVVRGSAAGHGGRAHSLTAPTPRGQAETITAALATAGVSPASVGYVETHGTGTRLGDPIEVQGLRQAFERAAAEHPGDGPAEGGTVLGALKASVGHLESAAGVAGVIAAVHALRDRVLPPVTGLGELNPYLELEGSPFRVLREPEPWRPGEGGTLRAGVSSFGFGGVNAHVVLEEPPPVPGEPSGTHDGPQVVVLSARTREQLREYARRLSRFAGGGRVRLADLAWTSQTGRTALAERLAVVASSLPELGERLDAYLRDTGEAGSPGVHTGGPGGPDADGGRPVVPADPADAAARWTAGEPVEWRALHPGPRRRVSFPGYPFDHGTAFGPPGMPAGTAEPAPAGGGSGRADTDGNPDPGGTGETGTDGAGEELREESGGPGGTGGGAEGSRAGNGAGHSGERETAVPALLTRGWVPSPPPAANGSRQRPLGVLLVGAAGTLGFASAAAHAAGADKGGWVVVREHSLLPHLGPDEYDIGLADHAAGRALAEQLYQRYGRLDAVVDLVDLAPSPPGSGGDGAPLPREAARIGLLQELVRHATAAGDELTVLHVTRGRHPLRHSSPRAAGAAMAALVRAVGAEYRAVRASSLDLDPAGYGPAGAPGPGNPEGTEAPTEAPEDEAAAEAVLSLVRRELSAAGSVPAEVCLRGGERYVPGPLRPLAASPGLPEAPGEADAVLDPSRTYLVTGGTGGLGLAAAERLAALGARRLALLGLRPLPPRAQWAEPAEGDARTAALREAVVRLEQAGVQVAIHTGPLTDRAAVSGFLERVRSGLGPVGGVLHCAGAVHRKRPAFVRRLPEDVAGTWEPKMSGLAVLDELVRPDRPEFFVLYSSVSAVLPHLGVGLGDYAAANAHLDAYAAERNAAEGSGGTRYLSVAWGSWAGPGMGEITAAAYREQGFGALTRGTGLGLLERVLRERVPHAVAAAVVPGAWGTAAENTADTGETGKTGGREERAVTTGTGADRAAAQQAAEEFLLDVMTQELMLPRDAVTAAARFADLGVDSILIAGMVGRLEELTGSPLDPSVVLEHPTAERLARFLETEYPEGVRAWAAREKGTGPAPGTGGAQQPREVRERGEVREEQPARDPRTAPAAPRRHDPAAGPRPLAVIGMAGRFPGAPDTAAYWRLLAGGHSAVREVPASRWNADALYSPRQQPGGSVSRWGGFLDGIEEFDPEPFGIGAAEASHVDPLIRLVLECAEQTFRDAGYAREELAGSRTGVFAAAQTGAYAARIRTPHRSTVTGLNQNFAAAHLAQVYDLRGPHLVVDTACSSSLTALWMAEQSLRLGECDTALVAAADLLLDEMPFLKLSASGALSPDGVCRVFDTRANGLVLGEGAGALLVKPLDAALAAGDRVHAVVESVAVNNDGRTMGLTTPNPEAQEDVVRRALEAAGADPSSVGCVEAHGTGTMIGDPMELRALTRAFGETGTARGRCAVGSVKSNIGHALMAAGMAGLHKVVLALRHRQLPPTLHCETPNPRFNFAESPFFPNTALRPWQPLGGVRRAGVSAFGFGGVNCHAVLREPGAAELRARPSERAPLPPAGFRRVRHWVDREQETAPVPGVPVPATTGRPILPLEELT